MSKRYSRNFLLFCYTDFQTTPNKFQILKPPEDAEALSK